MAPVLAAFALAGCQGTIFEPGANPGAPPADGFTWGGDSGVVPPPSVPELPSPSPRFARLSHDQYEATTQDLLHLPAPPGLAAMFLNDATSGTFTNNTADLRVGSGLWQNYQSAAETLAERVTTAADALARVVPPEAATGTDLAARGRAFVSAFGRRAFRRPVTSAEVDRYAAIFAQGAMLYPEQDAFAAGVRITITAMLQSPHFLYRVETSSMLAGDVIPLSSWEIAARLSYALWNTMPDDELFRAADANELARFENVRAQVVRMLADPRARGMVDAFHYELLDMQKYADLDRSTTLFPEFSPELRDSMRGETQEFVRQVIFGARGDLTTLLTAPFTMADARIARVYGLTGTFPTDHFVMAPLDPTRRAGILTQIGFLSANATMTSTDPIHRGVFINRRILCATLPAPPNNVPPLPPAMGTLTMRQRITMHTGPGTCGASCHGTMINPVGFAYEHYDALGRWRDTDNGLPVDAHDTYVFEGQALSYDGAVDFARVAVGTQMAHRCYAQHWLEYTYARPPTTTDRPLVERVATASRQSHLPVVDVITELVTSRAFVTRTTQELDL